MKPRSTSLACATGVMCAALASSPAMAQRVTKEPAVARPDTAWFAVLAGVDTLAFETVIRHAARVEGDLRLIRPQGAAIQYVLFTRPDGTADSLHTVQLTGQAATRGDITFTGDSAVLVMHAPGLASPRIDRIATGPGALPFINLSAGILDQVFRRARVVGSEGVTIPLVAGPQVLPGAVRLIGSDSAVLDLNVPLRAAIGRDGAFQGAVVPSQNVRFVRLAARPAQRASMAANAGEHYAAPPGAPYAARNVAVRTPGGFTLAGTLTLPSWASAARPAPVVVTISGSGPQNRDSELVGITGYAIFRQLADTLGRAGVGVLRLDDRGVGESGGAATQPTSADFASDIRAAVDWLATQAVVDASRIGLLGHSEGGIIAPMVAGDDARIRAVALLATQSRPGHELSAHQRRIMIAQDSMLPAHGRDSLFAVAQAHSDSLVRSGAADPWTRYWWSYDPAPALRRVQVPVLVVHGETDMQVPVAQARETAALLRESGNGDVTVRTFPAVNHLLLDDPVGHWGGYQALPSKAVSPVVMGTIADWFATRLATSTGR
ncbi:MAG: alpha/beta fold hydrolase [Gemmatimonadaceae bacterium]|nr:alpha/beta fold hydrolase [Gemmatimonadaceae bacterium]